MKYFVGRTKDIYPFQIYSYVKYFETDQVIWRGDSLEEGRKEMKKANKKKKIEKIEKIEKVEIQGKLFRTKEI